MVIAFATERLGTFQSPPIWGDDRLAVGLKKYMERLPDISRVDLIDKHTPVSEDVDVLILLQRTHTQRAKKTVYWYQNDHDYDLKELERDFDGLLLASSHHAHQAAFTDVDKWIYEPVIYADPDEFPKMSRTAYYPVVYLGNNIKGDKVREQYIDPAAGFGLHMFGSGWQNTPLAIYDHGPLRGMRSNAQVYTNADIVLSCHLPKHYDWDLPVVRTTEAMMAGALVISDLVGASIYGDRVRYTTGYGDLSDKVRYWLKDEDGRKQMAQDNKEWAKEELSFEVQAPRIVEFCKSLF